MLYLEVKREGQWVLLTEREFTDFESAKAMLKKLYLSGRINCPQIGEYRITGISGWPYFTYNGGADSDSKRFKWKWYTES